MSDEPTLLYLETDDEVTTVVRRVRAAPPGRIVLVAPGRSRALSSVVAHRLLARMAEETGRALAVVGDPLTRSLAAEAGLDAHASVDDARNAVSEPRAVGQPEGAAIHVVRGRADDRTEARPIATPAWADAPTETRPVPAVPRAARRPRAVATGRRARRALPVAILLASVALLVGAGVLGAVVVPAATIELVPRSEPLGPVAYELRIDDPERVSGSATETVTVTATGTYPIQARATGAVLFRNWNFVPIEVAAGTLVAAGEQAFETGATIVVPPGALTSDGRIQAGEEAVGVIASAVGPAANVAADAIDTVLTRNVAARLRGFPNNPERLVVNPEPTTGGVDTTGVEMTQADVDAALAALLQALDVEVAEALAVTGDRVFADEPERAEPVLEGLDGLVGTRDQEAAEIRGTLAYDRLVVDRADVLSLAHERLATDGGIVPEGYQLLSAATSVEVGEARRDGDTLVVSVAMTAASRPEIDPADVVERVRGRSADEARRAVADIGDATISLWPAWVEAVPTLDWRIEVTVAGDPRELPNPSASGSAQP